MSISNCASLQYRTKSCNAGINGTYEVNGRVRATMYDAARTLHLVAMHRRQISSRHRPNRAVEQWMKQTVTIWERTAPMHILQTCGWTQLYVHASIVL